MLCFNYDIVRERREQVKSRRVPEICLALDAASAIDFERDAGDQIRLVGAQKAGGIGYVLLWILGVPLPVLILIALVRGCA